jgi:hypothetical protein
VGISPERSIRVNLSLAIIFAPFLPRSTIGISIQNFTSDERISQAWVLPV